MATAIDSRRIASGGPAPTPGTLAQIFFDGVSAGAEGAGAAVPTNGAVRASLAPEADETPPKAPVVA